MCVVERSSLPVLFSEMSEISFERDNYTWMLPHSIEREYKLKDASIDSLKHPMTPPSSFGWPVYPKTNVVLRYSLLLIHEGAFLIRGHYLPC